MKAPVMIIDGSPTRIKIHAVCLRREAIAERAETDAVSFLDAGNALDYLVAHPYYVPTVILLDGDLPCISGKSVLNWLRTLTRLDATAIIVFSKQADAFHQFHSTATNGEGVDALLKRFNTLWDAAKSTLAQWHGANHVLSKPFKTSEVIALVSLYVSPYATREQETQYSYGKGDSHAYSVSP